MLYLQKKYSVSMTQGPSAHGHLGRVTVFLFPPDNWILHNHFPLLINRKPLLPWLQCYPTIPITRSFPGCFGSFQGFFKGMAVVSGHIEGEDNPRYGQRVVHMTKSRTPPCEVLPMLSTHCIPCRSRNPFSLSFGNSDSRYVIPVPSESPGITATNLLSEGIGHDSSHSDSEKKGARNMSSV